MNDIDDLRERLRKVIADTSRDSSAQTHAGELTADEWIMFNVCYVCAELYIKQHHPTVSDIERTVDVANNLLGELAVSTERLPRDHSN